MKPQPNFFSTALADYLQSEGMTQESIARRLGVTNATVFNWVKGKSSPTPIKMQEIADELGITFICSPKDK